MVSNYACPRCGLFLENPNDLESHIEEDHLGRLRPNEEPVECVVDKAVYEAEEMLLNTICECGHWVGEHFTDEDRKPSLCAYEECDCEKFTAVEFIVRRKPHGRKRRT